MRLRITTAALLVFSASPAAAQFGFKACLDGGQELPPVVTSGSGEAMVVADTLTNLVTVTGTYSNLSSNAVAADLYFGDPLTPTFNLYMSLTVTGGTSGTFSGQMTLSQTQVGHVTRALTFINITSATQPGGEIRGQVAQRMTIDCPAELPTDPALADISGDPLCGPKIGNPTEAFNVSLDCTNAAPGPYVIVVEVGKAIPLQTPRGTLWIGGTRFARATGLQAGNVVSFAPADVVVPNDITLIGVSYTVQGFCGTRLSNGLYEFVGIGS